MNTTEQLVTRVLEGDMKAFEELYNLTNKQVYYACFSFMCNEQDAMDVLQDTYLAGLTHLQSLQDRGRFCQWITQIAVNKCKTLLSKKQIAYADDELLESLPMEEDDYFLPENYVVNTEKRQLVLNIMSETLTVAQYQTIVLYYFDGLTAQEIADSMGCTVGTVTSRLSAARGKIKLGVQQYESQTGEKLYSVTAVPFLTALFWAEAENLVIPNVLGNILGAAIGGAMQYTAPAMATAPMESVQPAMATAPVDPVQPVIQPTITPVAQPGFVGAKPVATKKIVSALFASAKRKIIVTAVGLTLLGGIGAAVILSNKDDDKKHRDKEDNIVTEYSDAENGQGNSNPADTSAQDAASTEERDQGEEILGQGEEITAEPTTEASNGLSSDPLPLIANYGDENHFAFSSDGKNYIFTATDTIKLFSASGDWDESYENIVIDDAVFMLVVDERYLVKLFDYTYENFNKYSEDMELLYNEGDLSLYYRLEEYEDDPEMEPDENYYLKIKDLYFRVEYNKDNEYGLTLDNLWVKLKEFTTCVEEAQGDVTDLALHGNVMSMELLPGYRFAFRPSESPSWHYMPNANGGNTVYREESTRLDLRMNMYRDGEYCFVSLEYEKFADTIGHLDYDRNVVDTGLKFGEYTIYENTSDYLTDREFFIWIPENEEIVTIETTDIEMTPEIALEIFEIAFIPVE
ncbi:MAG: RNA polymerase sigma factor [Lachnospiraceae bacterium]|nr:RNA polymerase sigma factor [Lachnospiraceae bacterium]